MDLYYYWLLFRLLLQPLTKCLVFHYRLTVGFTHTYWATILRSIQDGARVPHTILGFYLPVVININVIVRSSIILLYHDQLTFDLRFFLFFEQVPIEMRRDLDIMILAWGAIYICTMLLDFTRSTDQMKHFLILVVEPKPEKDWQMFFRLRRFALRQASLITAYLATIGMMVGIFQTYITGIFGIIPWISIFYFYSIFVWTCIVCYPIFPLMSVLFLWIVKLNTLQCRLQNELTILNRKLRFSGLTSIQLNKWLARYNQMSSELSYINSDYYQAYLSILVFILVVPIVYLIPVVFLREISFVLGPILFGLSLIANFAYIMLTLLSCSMLPRRHVRIGRQLVTTYYQFGKTNLFSTYANLKTANNVENFQRNRVCFTLSNGEQIRTITVIAFWLYASQLFFLIFN